MDSAEYLNLFGYFFWQVKNIVEGREIYKLVHANTNFERYIRAGDGTSSRVSILDPNKYKDIMLVILLSTKEIECSLVSLVHLSTPSITKFHKILKIDALHGFTFSTLCIICFGWFTIWIILGNVLFE